MICFDIGSTKFNYRVAGIAIHNGKVLFQKGKSDTFWALPGGRCELMEESDNTLKREMVEELTESVRVGKLKLIVENFFKYNSKSYHEIGFYYFMHFNSSSKILNLESFKGVEKDTGLTFKWIDIEDFDKVDIKPIFLKEAIKNPPKTTKHIVINEL
jgi:ADP-ribose pyrophosphatase YjhB (NUDIX family)